MPWASRFALASARDRPEAVARRCQVAPLHVAQTHPGQGQRAAARVVQLLADGERRSVAGHATGRGLPANEMDAPDVVERGGQRRPGRRPARNSTWARFGSARAPVSDHPAPGTADRCARGRRPLCPAGPAARPAATWCRSGQRLPRAAQTRAEVAQLVVGVDLADAVVQVEQAQPPQVEGPRPFVADGGGGPHRRPPGNTARRGADRRPPGRGSRAAPAARCWPASAACPPATGRRTAASVGSRSGSTAPSSEDPLELVAEGPLRLARHGGHRLRQDEVPLGQAGQQAPHLLDGRIGREHSSGRRGARHAAAPGPPRLRSRKRARRRPPGSAGSRSAGLSCAMPRVGLASGSSSRLTGSARVSSKPGRASLGGAQQPVLLVEPKELGQQRRVAARLRRRPLGQAGRQGIGVQDRADEHVHLQARQRVSGRPAPGCPALAPSSDAGRTAPGARSPPAPAAPRRSLPPSRPARRGTDRRPGGRRRWQ